MFNYYEVLRSTTTRDDINHKSSNILGELITVEYGICHVAKDKALIKKLGATDVAEYIAGALTALMLVI